jgi:hypothetical protein
MPTIIPNQTFKHGAETYEEGESYEVSEGEAYYFQMSGWVGEKPDSATHATLEVHDSTLGHEAEVN